MLDPIYIEHKAPYVWMKAYNFGDQKFRIRKREVLESVGSENPFFTINCVKLVQVACLALEITFDMGVYRNMRWSVFKDNVVTTLKTCQKDMPFECDQIKDILFTNSPHELSPAINCNENDLFTVIPDNSTVFISQIKVDGIWIFYK